MGEFWFKPHRYGYGATPTTWQAWAVSLAFIVVFVVCARVVVFWLTGTPWAAFGLIGVALLLGDPFLWFCRRKTDGAWRWRWSRDPAP